MSGTVLLRKTTVVLLLASVLLPVEAFAAEPVIKKKVTFVNVELSESNTLQGQVLSVDGIGIPALPVFVESRERQLTTSTDKQGFFALSIPAGGTCVIRVGDDYYPCRVWKNGTAPPKSISRIALLHDESKVVRGNIFRRNQCPQNCECQECQRKGWSSEKKYGLSVLALGAAAAYLALSRDNASE